MITGAWSVLFGPFPAIHRKHPRIMDHSKCAPLMGLLFLSIVSTSVCAQELTTNRQQASYAIGLSIARNLKQQGLEVDAASLALAISDELQGRPQRLTDEQCNAALTALHKEMDEKAQMAGQQNKEAGVAFLQANAKKQGVTTLPSGLQYQVLKAGDGPSPGPNDRVRTHYHGTLINGEVFDSSVRRGEPAVFPVGAVIRGWTEALQKMRVGDKWKLFIPSELAYGPQGRPPVIGPNSVLVFEIELLGIE